DGTAPRNRLASVGGFDRTGAGTQEKVLLAEDDPLVKEVLRTWLAPRGFDVQVPASAAEAGRLLRRNSSDWILAIVGNTASASLSGSMDEAIQTALPSLPIVYLSDSPALRPPEMPGGATPVVLQKPFTRRQLHELVLNYSRKQSGT